MHEYMQGAHACAHTQKPEEVVGCLYHPIPLRQDLSLGLTFSHLEEKLGSPSNPHVSACLRAELMATCETISLACGSEDPNSGPHDGADPNAEPALQLQHCNLCLLFLFTLPCSFSCTLLASSYCNKRLRQTYKAKRLFGLQFWKFQSMSGDPVAF